MLKAMTNLNSYRIQTKKIREQRKIFYDLHRIDDESIELWLNRVESVTNHCEFPVFAKFMLIDKFASELNDDEIELMLRSDVRRRTWSYKQVREYVLDCKNQKPEIKRSTESNNETTEDNDEIVPKVVPPNNDEILPVNLGIVKSEPIDDDWVQQNEFLDEVNYLLQSSTAFARKTIKSKAVAIAEPPTIKPTAVKPPALTPAPVSVRSARQSKPKISTNNHVIIKGVKSEIKNYEFTIAEALEAAAAAANADANADGSAEDDNESLPVYQPYAQIEVNPSSNNEHAAMKFYACNQCNRTFSHLKSLKRHSMLHIEPSFDCDECDMSFDRPNQLKSHKICVHQALHPFTCDECGKHFGTTSALHAHEATHIGERPYACDICDKTFSLLNNLNVHKRNVHLGVRSHRCDECGKRFACKRNLQYHLGTHKTEKPYKCKHCNKSFPQPENLFRHQKVIHAEARLHVCEKCDKSFSNSSNLKRHLLQHNNMKSFQCNVCKISFRSEAVLTKHKQKFHSRYAMKPLRYQ